MQNGKAPDVLLCALICNISFLGGGQTATNVWPTCITTRGVPTQLQQAQAFWLCGSTDRGPTMASSRNVLDNCSICCMVRVKIKVSGRGKRGGERSYWGQKERRRGGEDIGRQSKQWRQKQRLGKEDSYMWQGRLTSWEVGKA